MSAANKASLVAFDHKRYYASSLLPLLLLLPRALSFPFFTLSLRILRTLLRVSHFPYFSSFDPSNFPLHFRIFYFLFWLFFFHNSDWFDHIRFIFLPCFGFLSFGFFDLVGFDWKWHCRCVFMIRILMDGLDWIGFVGWSLFGLCGDFLGFDFFGWLI